MILKHPPLRRFFYVCLAATAIGFGCRAVNAEPVDAGFKSQADFSTKAPDRLKGDLIAVASRYLGARNPTGARGPWCGHFVNLVLRRAGYRPMPGNRAIDGLRAGRRVVDPIQGDLAVMRRHVTIYMQAGGRGFYGLGGNQGGRVRVSNFPTAQVIAFVRPQ